MDGNEWFRYAKRDGKARVETSTSGKRNLIVYWYKFCKASENKGTELKTALGNKYKIVYSFFRDRSRKEPILSTTTRPKDAKIHNIQQVYSKVRGLRVPNELS